MGFLYYIIYIFYIGKYKCKVHYYNLKKSLTWAIVVFELCIETASGVFVWNWNIHQSYFDSLKQNILFSALK